MVLLAAAALLPTVWLTPRGEVVSPAGDARILPGVRTLRGPRTAVVYDFAGGESGIGLPDPAGLRGARSLTVAAWVWMDEVPTRPGQLVFRGDDRNGNDPFSLVVWPDGSLHFGVADERDHGVNVSAPLPRKRWTHVVGTLDDRTGLLSLAFDGRVLAQTKTDIRPGADLDPTQTPGLGIGNLQSTGVHNQPFVGRLADVRVYPFVVAPPDAGYDPVGWNVPYGITGGSEG
jgi:hypothetical protein